MSLASAIASGRRAAESRMTSRAKIRRRTGAAPGPTGFDVDTYTITHTDLPFRLGGSDRGGSGTRTTRVGDAEVQLAVRIGHFPAATVGLADGDLIEVTAGENVGAVLRIVEASWQDQATARRVPVVEAQRPPEWT